MEKVQIGPQITREAKAMLVEMSNADLRSLGHWLEWLIRREHASRNAPARRLVDTKASYETTDSKEA